MFSSTEFWFWFDKPAVHADLEPREREPADRPDRQIVVTLHSQAIWGNSPETVVSQVVAEEFDVDPVLDQRSPTPTRSTRCPAPGRAARATR